MKPTRRHVLAGLSALAVASIAITPMLGVGTAYAADGDTTANLAPVALNGVEGRFPFSDALELARKQEERIARQR